MQKARLKRLLHQYFNNIISDADCIELLDYLNSSDSGELNELIDAELSVMEEGPGFKGQQSLDVLNRIKSDPRFSKIPAEIESSQTPIVKFYKKRWLQIAAAVLVFCTAGIIVLNNKHLKTDRGTTTRNEKNIKSV